MHHEAMALYLFVGMARGNFKYCDNADALTDGVGEPNCDERVA
jgi:hypothetical protein